MLTAALDEFISRMPKVELHLHLEGTITPRTLLELARRNRVELPANDEAGIARLFQYRDFGEFLKVFMTLAQAIVSGEDFERLGYELGLDLAAQQVRYAEVMISPMQYIRRVDLREAIEGVTSGFGRARRETGVIIKLALDYGRQYGPEQAWNVLEIARDTMDCGVVGWSIGGNEIGFPPEPYAQVFAAARAAGLGVMAHAGEVVGPASVWGAIDALGATRIGHGIRSVDDPRLLETLRERKIVLDVCPSSNLLTGAVASWGQHPLPQLLAAGITVTINSDDPTFFATTLSEEYRRAVTHFGFDADSLCMAVRSAAEAAFMPAPERATLLGQLDSELADLRRSLGV